MSAEAIGPNFVNAVALARELHSQQRRMGTEIPYLAHLLGVAAIVLDAGGDETTAIGALLHDAPEDQGGRATLEQIRTRFGAQVADIVESCSDTFENPKPEWRERKTQYVAHLREDELPRGALLVSLADKLHNARAILFDLREHGETLWSRFNADGAADQLWYYGSLVEAFRSRGAYPQLVDELARTVDQIAEIHAAGSGVDSPLGHLNEFFDGLAQAAGGTSTDLTAALPDSDRRAVDRVLRLIRELRVAHTLNTSGWVIVPVDGGERDLVLQPIALQGQEWIHVRIYLRVEASTDAQTIARVHAFFDDEGYYGGKWLPAGDAVVLGADVPADGITAAGLEAIMKRLAWIARTVEPRLQELGVGRPLESVFRQKGYPLDDTLLSPSGD